MSTANVKISQLPELSTMTGNAVMPVVANGVTQKITGANLANFFVGNSNGTPGGSNTQVQFNDSGSFGGVTNFSFNKTSNVFTVPGNIVPASNSTASLGTATSQWKDLYVSNSTIYMNNVPLTLTSGNVLTVAGNAVLTVGNNISNIGQFVFNGNALQNPNGGSFNNGSLGTGQTSGLSLPAGGGTNPLIIFNTYGNNIIQSGVASDITAQWTFSNNGNLTLPGNAILGDVYGDGGSSLQASNGSYTGINSSNQQQWVEVDDVNAYIGVAFGTGQDKQWQFDQTGNITLPSNTASINYANGQPYGGGGGAANTGNVTFSDQVIQGTGTPDGGSGLYLAPGVDSTANLQYLRVRGGDYVTHIHMDTGNGAFFDQYFGADLKYVKLEANGNVVINTSDFLNGGSNSATWNFGTDGNLTLPNNANIATIGNVTQINTGANGFLSLNSFDAGGNNIARVGVDSIDKVVFIAVSDPVAEIDYTWAFGNGGGTIFPTLDVQRGDNPSGTITGQTLLFGNPLQEAIISTPDGFSESEYSQRLVINPGAGYDFGEGGDIYLWAGRGGNGSGSGGDIKIRGGQGGANTMGGAGGSGGYIRVEAGDAATTGGVPGYIDMNAGVNYVGAGGYVAVQGGQGQTIGGDANIRGGYGVDDRGGNVNIWGGGTGNGQVNEGYVNIQTGGNTWTFDSTGNLTLPANTFAVKYANGTQVSLGGGSTGNVTFNNQVVQGTGDDSGGGGLYLAPGTASTANLQYLRVRGGDYITHIHLDTGNNAYYDQYFGDDSKYVKLEGTGNVSVQASDYVNGGANTATWVFGTDGSVTIPGAIVGNGNLHLQPDPANTGAYLDIYLTYGPDIHIAKTDSNVIIGGDSAANVTVNATGNVSIQSWNGTANVWNFSADGVLFAPGNISAIGNVIGGNVIVSGSGGDMTMTGGNITGANVVTANTFVSNAFNVVTAGNLSITSQYGLGFTGTILEDNGTLELIAKGGGAVVAGWDSTYGNGLGNIATINFNEVGGEGIVLRTGNRAATEYNWNFTNTGNLTMPGNVTAYAVITAPVALANLTAVAGSRAFINNANLAASGNFGAQVGSGGSNVVPVWSDGTNWYIG
jgi:hypothetical protein